MDAKFEQFLYNKAKGFADDAAFNGSMHDGGASELRRQIEIYKAGEAGRIPDDWTKHFQEFNRKNDPEYDEFKRLQEKFGEY